MLSRTQSSTTKTYQYANTQWGDLLTTYYGQKIAYEGQTYSTSNTVSGTPVSGNPISYYGAGNRRWNMTWKNGRQLASATSTGRTVSYEYDKNGLRTSKTYNGTKYSYAYAGNKLVWQGWNGNEMYFFYDYAGTPVAFWYFPKGGSRITGYYFTNQQGDVVRIEDPDGNVLASYAYNAWGTMYKSSGTMANINPLRYRGYYYDAETDFYYLQSRYYDPIVSRFINADSYASTGQGFLGYNMFLYCGNNPVNRTDSNGDLSQRLDFNTCGGGGGAILIAAAIYGGVAIYGTVSSAIAAGQDAWNKAISQTNANAQEKEQEKDIAPSKPRRDPVHHIVAKADPRAAESRKILSDVGIEPMSDSRNLVILPQNYHASLHTTAYHNYVTERLRPVAGDKVGVEATLASLKIEIIIRLTMGIRWD